MVILYVKSAQIFDKYWHCMLYPESSWVLPLTLDTNENTVIVFKKGVSLKDVQ